VAPVADLQLVIVEGPDAGREFDLAGAIVAGRDPESGIVIDDAEASRKHASFSAEGASVTVEDLASTNGTFVNGERLAGARTIGEGDRVRIGTTVFELRALTQATSVGTAIPEPDDFQATRVGGTAIPDAPPPTPAPQASSAPQGPPPAGPPAGGAPPPPPSGPPPGAAPGPPPSFPPPQQPGAFAQPGRPPAPYGQGAMATGGYPVTFEADYPQGGIDRWRPFVQGWLLTIPHWFALFFVAIGAYIAIIISWFAVLITGRYPRGLFDFVAGTLRWSNRVTGYTYLMTEQYPPFSMGEEPQYPIRTRFQYPEKIARWRPLVHWLLAIPHLIVVYFLALAAFFAYVIVWFSIVFTRAYPPGLFNFIAGVQRWNTRVVAYYLWMTEEYPPFGLG
jgi:hypothetical protein